MCYSQEDIENFKKEFEKQQNEETPESDATAAPTTLPITPAIPTPQEVAAAE